MRRLLIMTIFATVGGSPLAAQPPAKPPAQPPAEVYDRTAPITLEGTADLVEWSNGGGKLTLKPNTGAQMWQIALPDIATLLQKGVSANVLARGTPVKVRVYKAKDGACNPDCKAQAIDLTVDGGGRTYALLNAAPTG